MAQVTKNWTKDKLATVQSKMQSVIKQDYPIAMDEVTRKIADNYDEVQRALGTVSVSDDESTTYGLQWWPMTREALRDAVKLNKRTTCPLDYINLGPLVE